LKPFRVCRQLTGNREPLLSTWNSSRMNKIIPLENPVMNYAWGSKTFIPALLGEAAPSDEPQAELWMGAHPKAPSRIGKQTLIELIADNPVGMLGAETAERFEGRLPFLFKLLAAGAPLSIQAHPNKAQAEEGFAAETAAGIALDAPNRNYKDANHKPEILCALSEFWALNGFREIRQMLELLDEAQLHTIGPERDSLT
jgi:mannose-6-phosphate isomerase